MAKTGRRKLLVASIGIATLTVVEGLACGNPVEPGCAPNCDAAVDTAPGDGGTDAPIDAPTDATPDAP